MFYKIRLFLLHNWIREYNIRPRKSRGMKKGFSQGGVNEEIRYKRYAFLIGLGGILSQSYETALAKINHCLRFSGNYVGSRTKNSVPCFSTEFTVISPPCAFTIS